MDPNAVSMLKAYRQKKARLAVIEREQPDGREQETDDLRQFVWMVETMLSGLDARQRFIVEAFYLDNFKREQILDKFICQFNDGKEYSRKSIERIAHNAKSKMQWILDASF